MAELGAGGGKGDLDQQHELEVGDAGTLGMLMSLCATKMQDQPQRLSSVLQMLASFMRDPVRTITLDSTMLHPDQTGLNQEDISELEQLPIDSLIPALASLAAKAKEQGSDSAITSEIRQDMKLAQRTNLSFPKRVVRNHPTVLIIRLY
jgi:DNA cross-link repair 1C protein